MIAALQGAAADGSLPWKEIIGILVVAAGVLLILVRHGLRKPPDLATVDEVKASQQEFLMWIKHMEDKLDDMKTQMMRDTMDFKEFCAADKDLNALGAKVSQIEQFYLTVNDRTITALNRSSKALREVRGLQSDMEDVKLCIRDLVSKIEPIPERLGRIDENVKILIAGRKGGS